MKPIVSYSPTTLSVTVTAEPDDQMLDCPTRVLSQGADNPLEYWQMARSSLHSFCMPTA